MARSSMIPSWAGTVVREELENVFAYPVTVDNDSNCAALTEMRWGAGRGYLAHHLTMDNGVLTNYQICTPSTTNASPRDPFGNPGPYEEAVLGTPILEQFN